MKISVIIPTFNCQKYLDSCLKSLESQSLKPDEIIVIDDGSSDKTVSVLSSLKSQISNLKLLSQSHQGPAAARNYAAKTANGQILVFVDSDMEFDKGFIKKLTQPIKKGTARGTFSHLEYVKNWNNPWARAFSSCLGLKTNRLIPKNYPKFAPVFRAILKTEFDHVGGFDTNRGYDDDWSLSEKLGFKAKAAPQAVYYHHNPDSLLAIFRQARWRASRRFKYGIFGKVIVFSKTFFLFPFSPVFFSLFYQNPYLFIVKPIFDLGTLAGLIKYRPKK